MPASAPVSLPENIVLVLQNSLEQFKGAIPKKRKALIVDLARETLPPGGNEKRHKKVSWLWFIGWYGGLVCLKC
jgi:hypothetical protein